MSSGVTRYQFLFSVGILLLIAALYSLLSFWTPPAFDDYTFMAEWREVNGDSPLSLNALYNFWASIREVDNGRLANVASPVFSLYSPWNVLMPVFTGILVAYIIAAVSNFSFRKDCFSPLCLSAVWAAVLYFLPWRNSLFVADYSLNYIWGAAITLAFMSTAVYNEREGWDIVNFIIALILAFLAGGWHEGFAVATICGFLLYTCIKRGKFSPYWYITGIFYTAVTLIFYLCPGMLQRTSREIAVPSLGINLIKLLFDFLPIIFSVGLIIIFGIVPSLRKYLRKACGNVWFIVGGGIIIAGILLSLLFNHQPRSAFWPDIFGIVQIFILTAPFWEKLESSLFRGFVTALLLAAVFVPLCFILSYQYGYFKESKAILAKIEGSQSGTVYHDIIDSSSLPPYTLKIPTHNLWVTAFQYQALGQHIGKEYPAVVPSELKDSIKSVRLGGNQGALSTGKSIYLESLLSDKPETLEVKVITTDGAEKVAPALFLPYLSPQNRPRTYILVYGIPVEDIRSLSL